MPRINTETILTVDKEAFKNEMGQIAALGIGMNASFYQAFIGVKPGEYKVTKRSFRYRIISGITQSK